MDTSMESDDIIDADDVDVEPEDTGNVHSDEEHDADSDDECPYEYHRWDESDEKDDSCENILSPQSARGSVELDEVEDDDHGDDEESDRDSPGDVRDPQPNEAEREQGERGEQDGGEMVMLTTTPQVMNIHMSITGGFGTTPYLRMR